MHILCGLKQLRRMMIYRDKKTDANKNMDSPKIIKKEVWDALPEAAKEILLNNSFEPAKIDYIGLGYPPRTYKRTLLVKN